jgi:hypothetical protein
MNKHTFIAATLGLLLASSSASAATVGNIVDLGTLSTAHIGSTYTIGTSGLAIGDSFIDTYLFDIASDYAFAVGTTVSIDIANLYQIGNLAARFLRADDTLISNAFTLTSTTNNGIQVNSLYLDTTLPAGNDYKFVVSGTINGTVGGSYGGVLQATPIPEADSYLLMLAGLGCIGIAIRRKVRNHPAGVPV